MQRSEHGDPIRTLIEAASHQRVATIRYRKRASDTRLVPRSVEPYALSEGNCGMLVRCYQLAPELGWRTFSAHKIVSTEMTDRIFKPRRKITIPAAVLEQRMARRNAEPTILMTPGRRAYLDIVLDAMADGDVSAEELAAIETMKQQGEIELDDVRYAHAHLLHQCLGLSLADGEVSTEEVNEMRFLQRVFAALGWRVGDA
ncbi:MAG: WYL domain-containing protein [Planctomycetota bacterium]